MSPNVWFEAVSSGGTRSGGGSGASSSAGAMDSVPSGILMREGEPAVYVEANVIQLASEETFERLARRDPSQLVRWMRAGMKPTRLTFAAEILGRSTSAPDALRVLVELTRHDVVYVREGALYGLGGHLAVAEVREAVRQVASADPVPALRALATELLEG